MYARHPQPLGFAQSGFRHSRFLRTTLVALALIGLAACGGGGGYGGGGGGGSGMSGYTAPIITTQPASRSIASGSTATFSVVASGTPAPTIQWQTSFDGMNWTPIAGATGSTYTTPVETAADNGISFEAVATNSVGSVTSAPAVLTVN